MQRRTLLSVALLPIGAASGLYFLSSKTPPMTKTTGEFEITKTDAEWKAILTPEQFSVLRKHGTERAGTSILDKEYGKGQFVCAAAICRCLSPIPSLIVARVGRASTIQFPMRSRLPLTSRYFRLALRFTVVGVVDIWDTYLKTAPDQLDCDTV